MKKHIAALMLLAAQILSVPAVAAGDLDSTPPAGQTEPTEPLEQTTPADQTEPSKTTIPTEPNTPSVPEMPPASSTETVIETGPNLLTDNHLSYMSVNDALFRPDGNITRAEAAQILYRLLPQHPEVTVSYSDVAADAWYAQAALELGTLGVIRAGEDTFLPDEELTRSEFIRYIAYFFPPRTDAMQFSDVPDDHPNASYLLSARSWGWLGGFEDGTVRPEQPITRAEVAVLVNRALGRQADHAYIDNTHPVCCLDVAPSNWYYYDIVEAVVPHEHTETSGAEQWSAHTAIPCYLTEGFQWYDGWVYYYSAERGDIVRNDAMGSFDFNANGHLTSGSDELDSKLRDIYMTHTDDSMTREQKLRALYLYTRDSFTYLRRAPYAFGATGFMQKDALDMLNTGYGNCYSYASVFWYLSRWLGYDSQIYSGTVGRNKAPHCWVEIEFSGKNYIFDTELEMAYRKKGRYEINLYKYIDVDGWRYVR